MSVKIKLKNEMETLMIPLFGRAKMSESGLFKDIYSERIVKTIDYDFNSLKIIKKIQIALSVRAYLIDIYTNQFLRENKKSLVISIGSGLDSRYLRVNGYDKWIDMDLPDVVELREKLLPEAEKHLCVAASVSEYRWLDQCENEDCPVLIIAEGLLMYLDEFTVKTVLENLILKFPKATFIFDAFSSKAVKLCRFQTCLKKTGATVRWGVDTANEVSALVDGICHAETLYLVNIPKGLKLNKFYQTWFYIDNRLRTAREAHRIFVFKTSELASGEQLH